MGSHHQTDATKNQIDILSVAWMVELFRFACQRDDGLSNRAVQLGFSVTIWHNSRAACPREFCLMHPVSKQIVNSLKVIVFRPPRFQQIANATGCVSVATCYFKKIVSGVSIAAKRVRKAFALN
jgi:hypothetical protein